MHGQVSATVAPSPNTALTRGVRWMQFLTNMKSSNFSRTGAAGAPISSWCPTSRASSTTQDTKVSKSHLFHAIPPSTGVSGYELGLVYDCRSKAIHFSQPKAFQTANSNSELARLIKEYSGFEECDQEIIQDWLECDVDDPDYQVLADDEINASVIDDQRKRSR
ncbi:hypothetical protein AVEN_21551-1 [Araneus ventricosus]|uniref:Uncharacterized protein n=2 Tax=Araneus ventricosus TaxID=182803 RepID=A0A4Y2UT62_ARAVE|nr:hypothetical protein AVEN_21551-1 [Araneus ventricosus]